MGSQSLIGIVRTCSRRFVAQLCHWCSRIFTQTQRRSALANGMVVGILLQTRPLMAMECPPNRLERAEKPPSKAPRLEVAKCDLKITTRRVSEDLVLAHGPHSRIGLGFSHTHEGIRHAR